MTTLSIICREHESTDVTCHTCQREITRRSEIRGMLVRIALRRREEQREQRVTTIWHEDAWGHSVESPSTPATRQPLDYAPCICERDSISVAHYHAKQRYENAASVDENGKLIDVEVPDWSPEALDYVYGVRRRCRASLHFTSILADEWLMPDAETTVDDGFSRRNIEQYEQRQFTLHRSHIGMPWHDRYDDDSPYLPDPMNVLSERGWDREYAPLTEEEQPVVVPGEFRSDSHRQVMILTVELGEYGGETVEVRDDAPEADALLREGVVVDERPATETRLVGGSVAWEYRRRSQGRQPWMPKSTYRFVMDGERRRQRQQLLRSRIASLVRALGQDVTNPEIVAWVKSAGYEAACRALEARYAREQQAWAAEDDARDVALAGRTQREMEIA